MSTSMRNPGLKGSLSRASVMLVLVACCLTGISSASAAESAPFAADPPLRIGLIANGIAPGDLNLSVAPAAPQPTAPARPAPRR